MGSSGCSRTNVVTNPLAPTGEWYVRTATGPAARRVCHKGRTGTACGALAYPVGRWRLTIATTVKSPLSEACQTELGQPLFRFSSNLLCLVGVEIRCVGPSGPA